MKELQTLLNTGPSILVPGYSGNGVLGDVLYYISRLNIGHLNYLRTAPLILCQWVGLNPLF